MISLRPAERVLREFLLEAAESFPGLEIWVTGGWVRDHLLGIPSSDLDFSLNNLTGKQFGTFLESFSGRPEIQSKYSKRAEELGVPHYCDLKFTIIERNATMSKQLETARGKLFGLEIDLVNLRKETYREDNRTPEMEFGTAEEDACRRDATVNALFYHLKRQKVVDLTGRGLDDLQAKIMRTPLDPYQTFMDDPLRILRLIRIGSKLGFEIDAEAQASMRDDKVQVALDTIITRDRVNMELFKMIKDPHPETAFQKIYEYNLYTPVFLRLNSQLLGSLGQIFPQEQVPWPRRWSRTYQLLSSLLQSDCLFGKMLRSEKNVDGLWIVAAYAPLAELRHEKLKQAVQEATSAIKLTAKLSSLLQAALSNFDSIRDVVATVASGNNSQLQRSDVGMRIRSWGVSWPTQVLYVLLAQSMSIPDATTMDESGSELVEPLAMQKLLNQYTTFMDYIWSQGLQDAHIMRPIIDGHQIQELYELPTSGTFMKNVVEHLTAWQFDHAQATIDEAKAWLLHQREVLGVPQS